MGLAEAAEWVLGVGFCVQGFQQLPSATRDIFLEKDRILSPTALKIAGYVATLPVLGKPVYGIVSDALHIGAGHRMPYLIIGVLFQAISWLLISTLSDSSLTFSSLFSILFLGNVGMSIAEVMNDAIATEYGRPQPPCRLESLLVLFDSLGGLLSCTLMYMGLHNLTPHSILYLFCLILTLHFFLTISIPESSLQLPKKPKASSGSSMAVRRFAPRSQFMVSTMTVPTEAHSRFRRILMQLDDLVATVLTRSDIFYSICWFSASYSVVPFVRESMHNYLTVDMKLDTNAIGLSKVVGHTYVIVWCVLYPRLLKWVPPRRVLSALQGTIAVLLVLNVYFVKGVYREMGVPDNMYVIVFYGLLQGLIQCKELPYSILMGRICPIGCEGGLMAVVSVGKVLGNAAGSYFGVAAAWLIGERGGGDGLARFDLVLFVHAACALLPLIMSSWIYDDGKGKKKEE